MVSPVLGLSVTRVYMYVCTLTFACTACDFNLIKHRFLLVCETSYITATRNGFMILNFIEQGETISLGS